MHFVALKSIERVSILTPYMKILLDRALGCKKIYGLRGLGDTLMLSQMRQKIKSDLGMGNLRILMI